MKNIDTLLHARWLVPVDGKNRYLQNHSIAIVDDKIVDVLATEQAQKNYQARVNQHYPHHVLMPGLINSHTHAAMSLFRGLADDLSLNDWLQNHIWPAETHHVNQSFVQTGTQLAIAEMIRGGTTCFNDMYFFPDICAQVANKIGMRASVGLIVIDFPTVWASTTDEYIERGLAVFDQYKNHKLIHTAFAPHAPYTVCDESLQKVLTLANELEIPIHIHLHETQHEVAEAVAKTKQRPLARLNQLGLLSPALQAVHMTQLKPDEIKLLAKTGVHIIHCPKSNMKLASGICPVNDLLKAGVNVALGTDSCASNNNLDLFSEMQTAALLAKVSSEDATAINAEQAVQMATINGAKALSIEHITGSLEIGKAADIIAIDFDHIQTTPMYDPLSHLVYCCSREQVSDVWIGGKQCLSQGKLTTIDISTIKQESQKIAQSILKSNNT